jgi:zinc protease
MLKKYIPSYLLVLLLLILFSVSPAGALDIKRERLANGLSIVYVERHELPIVMATLLIKASPLQEDAQKSGTAYLTAKMLTEGTAKRKSLDISSQIEYIGASLDASVNSDFTAVSLSVLKKDIETGFDIFSDIVIHPSFHTDELSRRKALLAGALKKREEDPSYVAGREFSKKIFGPFPYARPVEGSVESIAGIVRDDAVRFYDSYYRPDNAVLVVVGDLNKEELLRLLNRYFAPWKPAQMQAGEKDSAQQPRTVLKKPRIEVIDRDVAQANIVLGRNGISRGNPDYYAVQVMNYVLGGGGFASRMMKTIRDEMGLTYGIFSLFSANLYPGAFEVEVQTKNESAGLVIAETLKQISAMRSKGVTAEELRDAKDYLIGSFPRRLETSRKMADFLAAVEFYKLGDDYIERYKDYIEKVSVEDVLRVSRKYLNEEDMEIVVVGNRKKLKL